MTNGIRTCCVRWILYRNAKCEPGGRGDYGVNAALASNQAS